MIEQAKAWLLGHQKELLDDLNRLLSIASVEGEPKPGMPFGEQVHEALMCVKNVVEKLGFTFHSVDNYVGYFDFIDSGEVPELGVITHLDVVPATNFSLPPYQLTAQSGRYYGRGILDDKGPAMLTIYAAKALKEAGFRPAKNMRILFGTNEETGWRDIDYYNAHAKMPKTGFSPDADYPVINEEKGIIRFDLDRVLDSPKIESIHSGLLPNMVPDKAECVVYGNLDQVISDLSVMNLDARTEDLGDGRIKLTFYGISAHASMLQKGVNAAKLMLEYLCSLDSALYGVRSLFQGNNGFGFGFVDNQVTLNLGIMQYEHNHLKLVGDVRYPNTYTFEDCKKLIDKSAYLYEVTYGHCMPPHYVSPDTHLVKSLLSAYAEETGEKGYTLTIGGGTFSRCFEEGVAFGCLFPGERMTAHQSDEYMEAESFWKNGAILIRAYHALCGQE